MNRFLIASLLLITLAGCAQQNKQDQWIEQVASEIQAGYGELNTQAVKLVETVQHHCAATVQAQEQSLVQVKAQWQATMLAWQRIQWVRFGPIATNNDDWKLQFWPDKKNLVARKVQEILNQKQPITQKHIAEASVVIQGLSALEYLIYEPAVQRSHCELLVAVAENVNVVSASLKTQWQSDGPFVTQWIQLSQTERAANLPNQAVGEVFDGLLAQMERIKLDKLGGPLGLKNRTKKPNGYFAESWRSGTSLNNIKANVAAFRLIVEGQGVGLVALLKHNHQSDLAHQLLQQVIQIQDTLATINVPLNKAVLDETNRKQVEALHNEFGALNSLLKNKVAPALNVSLGFNANDGD